MIVDKTYSLPFPLAQTYAAWLSPNTVIPPATRLEILPIVGGHYNLFIDSPEFSAACVGFFDIVEPNSQLRYTWQWDGEEEISVIEVTFSPTQSGTLIHLRHSGFSNLDSFDTHDSGWDRYIEGFSAYLASKN